MNPRLTMSRLRSGSRTIFSASRTDACSTCISSRISYTPGRVSGPSPNRGVMIVLAYLWPLALVPLLLEKNDPDVQWHAKHGIVLMIAELVLFFAYVTMTSLVSLASLGLGVFLGALLVFAPAAIVTIHVLGILKGLNGTRLILPTISEYANRI